MSKQSSIQGIYPILDADVLEANTLFCEKEVQNFQYGFESSLEKIARHLENSSIRVVQLRCKGTARRAWFFSSVWMLALRRYAPNILVVINDRVDLALGLDADGVHVGQDDIPVELCRRILGPDKLIGLSTHTLKEVLEANKSDADYIGYGPVFSTQSKGDTYSVRGLENLKTIGHQSKKPLVAIGGIQGDRIMKVSQMGINSVAMIGYLWDKDLWCQRIRQSELEWSNKNDTTPENGVIL